MATRKLPVDMSKIIQTMVHETAYKNDVEFIAPDDTHPEKAEISGSEEEEWVSGSDTEDESDYDSDWD